MRHQTADWTRRQHIAGCSAKNPFIKAVMTICPGHEQVSPRLRQTQGSDRRRIHVNFDPRLRLYPVPCQILNDGFDMFSPRIHFVLVADFKNSHALGFVQKRQRITNGAPCSRLSFHPITTWSATRDFTAAGTTRTGRPTPRMAAPISRTLWTSPDNLPFSIRIRSVDRASLISICVGNAISIATRFDDRFPRPPETYFRTPQVSLSSTRYQVAKHCRRSRRLRRPSAA